MYNTYFKKQVLTDLVNKIRFDRYPVSPVQKKLHETWTKEFMADTCRECHIQEFGCCCSYRNRNNVPAREFLTEKETFELDCLNITYRNTYMKNPSEKERFELERFMYHHL